MKSSLRSLIRRRAKGRCEYCRIPVRFEALPAQVDHVIAIQHGGKTARRNLALACAHCNAHKGTNLAGVDPETEGIVQLFNPRQDDWNQHFKLDGAVIVGRSPCGRATVRTLAMNDLRR